MKRLIATTALALVLASPTFVANAAVKDLTAIERLERGDILASTLIGMRIYATEEDVGTGPRVAETDWDDIGEVNDVIVTTDGNVKAVVLGVGGFLGIGERDIAIDMSSLNFVRESDDRDDFFLVVNASKETLMDIPAYERASAEPMDEAKTRDDAETAEADKMAKAETVQKDQMAAENKDDMDVMLTRPALTREGYRDAEVQEITTEMVEGARVYGLNDEDVGEIDRLIMTKDGKIEHAVVDVGGFLGIGEHSIAVTMDELQILRAEDGSGIRIFIDSTQSELERKPAYEG